MGMRLASRVSSREAPSRRAKAASSAPLAAPGCRRSDRSPEAAAGRRARAASGATPPADQWLAFAWQIIVRAKERCQGPENSRHPPRLPPNSRVCGNVCRARRNHDDSIKKVKGASRAHAVYRRQKIRRTEDEVELSRIRPIAFARRG